MKGYIHSTESFGSVDGPGVRFVIFVSGCPMRCQFCHNPDTWNMTDGELRSTDELIRSALRYRSYWKDGGGITVSGGEPLMQIDFLTELFRKAKEQGIHTTIDTSGALFTREEPFFGKFNELMKYTDLLLVDIKHIDDEQHRILTGRSNKNILDMAEYLSEIGKPVWIRTIDTSGALFTREEPFFGKFNELMKYTDLLLVDIKHIDDEQHRILTGRSNKNILDMAEYLSEIGKPVWIRHVLVPERNDTDEYLEKLYNFIKTLNNVQKVEVLPYHTLGEYKWKELGYDYPLAGIEPPTEERIRNANEILHTDKGTDSSR